MQPDAALEIFEIITVILLGLAFGSFATVLAHRGQIFSHGEEREELRSSCPNCKTTLKIMDLVPLFSWLLQKGKCRYCAKEISPVYPVIELTVVLMGMGYFYTHGFDPVSKMLLIYATISILVGLAVFDLRHKILPNNLIAMLGVLGIVYRFLPAYSGGDYTAQILEFGGGMVIYAVVIFLIGLFMHKILGKQALGMGDVKFFAVAGLWLGVSSFSTFCILSGVFGVFLGLLWRKIKGEAAFPFGPALIASFFMLLLLDGSHLL